MKKLWILLMCGWLLTGCGFTGTHHYEDGMALMEKQDYEGAAKSFQKAVDEKERLPESYRGLGISQLKLDNDAAAIAAFSRSLNEMNGSNKEFETDVMYYLAQARVSYGEYEKAVDVYSDMLKLKEDPRIYYVRGSLYLDLGEKEKAEADFDQAVKGSKDYDLYLDICSLYRDYGMNMKGENYLEKALEISPEDASDYTVRGRLYYEMKDYDGAKKELLKAIEKGDQEASLMLGKVYLSMGDVASARGMYQEYLRQEEHQARAYNGLAMCDIAEENYKDALANVEKGLACKDETEKQNLLYNEIVAYEYLLEFDTAKEKMEEYLKLYPDDSDALRENQFLSSR